MHTNQKSFKEQGNLPYDSREYHYTQNKDNQDYIQHQSEDKQREIMAEFRYKRPVPEYKNPRSHNNKNKLIYNSNCHKYHGTVRNPVSVFIHIVKLHRLSSCS